MLKDGVHTPETPSVDVDGKSKTASAQSESLNVNDGSKFGMIVMVSLTEFAHAPRTVLPSGLNVYVALERLLKAGVQVPEMLFKLVVGKTNEVPSHKLFTKEKLGVVGGTITTACCVDTRQDALLLLSGVNVYVALFWLLNAGDHVPEMEFVETVGKVSCPFKQMESSKLKVGTVDGIIFTVC